MNYPEIIDIKYMVEPVKDFLFPWEDAGSAENFIAIDEDEGFSARSARSIESLQNYSAARYLFDFFCL